MREFQERLQERNKIKKRMYSKTTLAFMLVVLVVLAQGVYGVYKKHELSKLELERTQNEYNDVEKRYNEISTKGKRLENNDGIELELRGKYDISKPNEKVIVVVEPENVPVPEEDIGFLKKMWGKVRGVFR